MCLSLVSFAVVVSVVSGCSGSSSGSLSSDAPPPADAPKLLAITPLTKTIALGATLNLEASGGTEPYTYDVYYGNGSISTVGATGTYQAPNSQGSAVVRAQDAAGNTGYANIEIIDAPVIQPTSKTLAVNNKFPFAVLSGKAPYTFSITSGEGTINTTTGEFIAGPNAGAVIVRVADTDGRTADATVTVNPALNFTTKTVYVEKNATYTLSATGGVAPYSYVIASGAGTVDKTTGIYTAPNTLGASTVYVVDSLGNFDIANLNITTILSINPSTALIAKNGNLTFSAVGGAPPYTYTIQTGGVGTIVSTTGVYTAPASTGSATVRVTDSLGHMSDSSVSITNNLSFSVANLILAVGNTFDISTIVNGGVTPLTYSASNSQGLFAGSTYTAPNTAGVYTITVSDSQSPTPNSIATSVLVNSALILLPSSATVAISSNKSFSASGGVPPYTYSIQSGGGSFTDGLYTAPTTAGSAVLLVTDAKGNTATASVSIEAALAITPSTKTLNAGESFTFTATGGNTPYSFSLVSGSGAINSSTGLYTAPGSSGLATVRVEDAMGNRKDALITILNPLSISPPTISLIKNGAITFTASGGVGPYSFSIAAGDGSVNATTGVFTAAATAGINTVRVTDSLGSIKDATVTIYDGLTISPFSKNLAVNQVFTFTAAGGVEPYTYSLNSGVGSVSAVGAYSSSTAGSAIVRVTDAASNTSDATISVNSILAINPTSKTLSVNNSYTFSAIGGVPPYAFSKVSGNGTITNAGDYTAPTSSTSAVVRVTDADGTTADATITVNDALTISPTNVTVAAGGTQSFITAGGVNPYTYTVTSGGGSFTGSTYTAPSIANGASVAIVVTDFLGNTANSTIIINPISVAIGVPNNSSVITNSTKASFSVSGTCTEAGRAITISATDGTNAAVTATPTCTNGSWSTNLNLSSLNDATITITANHSNLYSVVATTASVTLTKDGTAPTITITAPTASSYVGNSVTVTGVCTKVGPVNITVTGGISATTTCSDGSYSKLLDLSSTADGALTITVNHTDSAGNSATPATVNVSKNSVAPTIAISAPSTDIINSSGTVSYTLTYSGASNISVGTTDIVYTGSSAGCTAAISGSGTTSRTIAITSCSGDGSLQINIAANSAQNNAGLQAAASSLSTAVIIDNTLPVLTGLTNDATVHASKDWAWSCTETNGPCTYRFLVDTSASSPTFAGSFVTTSTASQLTGSGTYYLHVQAKDAVGNISNTTNVSTILNNTTTTVTLSAPSTTIMKAADTVTYTATYSGAASISLANNDIVLTGISSGCATTVSGTGLTTRTISITGCIGDGSLQINIAANSAQNSAGVQAAASSLSTAITVDNTLPVLTGLTNDNTPHTSKTWSWGCTETNGPCTYRYAIDTNPTYPFTVEAFSSTTSDSQLSGTNTYYLHIEAKDAVGNISTTTNASTILDNSAPTAPSGLALSTPSSSPGSVTTPTIQVSGVVSGDTVKLFTNSNCTTQVSSGTASGSTILLTSTTLTAGTYAFYANSTDPLSNISSCSTANVTYVLDLTNATITNVTAVSNGTYTTAGTFTISVEFSKVVNVTGTPVLALTTGQTAQATYSSGTGSNTLVFVYTVASGDNSSDLTYAATNSLTLAGGTIKDIANNDAIITLPAIGASGSLSYNRNIVIDTTAPTAPTITGDGTWMTSTGTSPNITFTAGTDGGTGILKHQIQVVLGSNTTTVLAAWADFNTSNTAITGLNLSDATLYKVQMKAIDNAGNESSVVTSTDGWTVDVTPPTAPGSVNDETTNASVSSSPSLSWAASSDSTSNINYYEVAIGTSAEGTQVQTWTSVANVTSATITGLSLTVGSTYYASVRAIDNAGNTSTAGQGNGWVVVIASSGTCPTGYILVPALAGYTNSDFCVAKYEMKNNSGAKSEAAGTPWVSIARGTDVTTAGGAWKTCKDLGAEYDLISNAQWQTIARNLADQATNWSTGTVYSGELSRGHSDGTPNNSLAASTNNDGCNGTGQTCSNTTWDSQRRTHTLSNGNVIWDFAGNVWEWVKDNNSSSQGATGYISTSNGGDSRQINYGNDSFCASPSATPYCGMGTGVTNYSAGAVYRGGTWLNGVDAGIFGVSLYYGVTYATVDIGFRCVYTPNPSVPGFVDDGTMSSLTSSPTISWTASTVTGGSIIDYEIAIGTTAGGTDTKNWTAVGNVTSATLTGLSLTTGSTYYASVRAIDNSGNISPAGLGDGFMATTSGTCPTGYISIPPLAGYTTMPFCVAKYEMKNNSGAKSEAAGAPWVSIARGTDATTASAAWKACKDLGAQYDLISNAQWQTIARNIADQATNWSTGTVYSGELSRGHSDSTPGNSLAASTDNDGCNGTGQTCSNTTWNSQRRTHTLSNGNVIWDFAGNVWEWVKDNNSSSQGADGYIATFNGGDSRQINYGNDSFCASPSSSPYCGMGIGWTNYSAGAVFRGGVWVSDVYAGIFTANLLDGASYTSTGLGFRCVFSPE